MKSVIYRNYDTECVYCGTPSREPIAECFNPFVYAMCGKFNKWVVNCNCCPYMFIEAQGFEYKVGVLLSKIGIKNV